MQHSDWPLGLTPPDADPESALGPFTQRVSKTLGVSTTFQILTASWVAGLAPLVYSEGACKPSIQERLRETRPTEVRPNTAAQQPGSWVHPCLWHYSL